MSESKAVWCCMQWTWWFSQVQQLCLFLWYLRVPFLPQIESFLAFMCNNYTNYFWSRCDVAIAAAMSVFATKASAAFLRNRA